MTVRIVFRPAAEDDLNALFEYLAHETTPRAAGEYTRRVHAACMALEMFPNRGAPRDDLGLGVRLLGFERRVAIAYEVGEAEVEILGLFFGGRDFETVLRAGR